MYAYNLRFLEATESVTFPLASGDKFYELNGRLFKPLVSESNGMVTVTHNFNAGDVFGAYVQLPIIQPDSYTNDSRDMILSKIYACMKQVQLSPFTTDVNNTYSLVNTNDNNYRQLSSINSGKFLRLDTLEEVEGTSFQSGQTYSILYCGVDHEAALHLIEGNPASYSQVEVKSVKGSNYQLYSFTPYRSFTCSAIALVNGYFSQVEGLDIPNSNNVVYDTADDVNLPVANPRFQFSTHNGLTSDDSYLFDLTEHTGQLPAFTVPAGLTAPFTVSIKTKQAWNRGNIKPVPAALSGFIASQNEWTVSVEEHGNYVETIFTLPALEFSEPQVYVWEDLRDN